MLRTRQFSCISVRKLTQNTNLRRCEARGEGSRKKVAYLSEFDATTSGLRAVSLKNPILVACRTYGSYRLKILVSVDRRVHKLVSPRYYGSLALDVFRLWPF
jgi:hypothetical protein